MTLFQAQNINSGWLWVRRRPVTEMKGLLQPSESTDLQALNQFLCDLPGERKKPLLQTLHRGEHSVALLPTLAIEMESNMEEVRYWYHSNIVILSAISKVLSADTTLAFVVLVFFPGLHQSLSTELGQSYLYDLSALAEVRKRNGQCYCLPVGNTPLSTQEHIKVDQSSMGSAPAGSRKGGKKSHGRGTTTSPDHQHHPQVVVQQKWSPPARIPTPELPECCKTPHRIDWFAPDGSTHPDAKSMALWYF